MPTPPEVLDLIERFANNRDDYQDDSYKEAHLRQEFIDPLFAALGWDMDNRAGKAEAYKDVIHEDAIKVGGGNKAPDYCFRIGGTRKFFVEAKKPAVNIKDEIDPAFQLRRYAWSAKLPLSILTDFEELAVYDCRIKPDKNDKPSVARVLYFRFSELAERWDELAGIFSKEAIEKGSFDKYAESNKRKRGTAEVDVAFLADIEAWRLDLAKNLALRNPRLDQRELNFAVQRIIDRIIFLRIAEDRGIEDYGRLQGLTNGDGVYRRLGEAFRRADDRYNSGLFHFEPDKGRQEPPDELTLDLDLDDKILRDLIRGLYYPESPYEFSVLSADILGQVYEQFLGKVIKLSAGHRAQVEEKPEVRKAGGVYYTPTYIVDYIVQQTVGKLLAGKTPKQAAKLRILDPACGSGSFLIGAYQYLLDWHRDWYIADGPEKHKKELNVGPKVGPSLRAGQQRQSLLHSGKANSPGDLPSASGPDGVGGLLSANYHLSIPERKRILINNIYGVDIDLQAVEVTKLSLCLKVLEGASRAALDQQLKIFDKNRALPDLGGNIKCGNSLIGPDFYNGQQMSLFDDEEKYRINVFDWSGKDGFAEIMKSGGFDAVIGNPPYVRQEGVSAFKAYLETRYKAYHGLADLYVYFLEREFQLLREQGFLGAICSGKFAQAGYGAALRVVLLKQTLERIIDYGDSQIFAGATTYPLVLIGQRGEPSPKNTIRYAKATKSSGLLPFDIEARAHQVAQTQLGISPWQFIPKAGSDIIRKMSKKGEPLMSVVGPAQLGIKTSLNEAFVVDAPTANRLIKGGKAARNIVKPYLRGRDLSKWATTGNGSFLVCARESIVLKEYPSIRQHLTRFEKKLRARYEVKRGDYDWWVIRQVADIDIFENPKIVYPDLCSRPSFALNTDKAYPNNTVFCIRSSSLALLALLNSKLIWYWITRTCPANRGNAYRLFNQYINQIPIPTDIAQETKLAGLAEQQIALHAKLAQTKPGHSRTVIERQIEATDRQIDQLVYQLYGLTDEEIALVEGGTK